MTPRANKMPQAMPLDEQMDYLALFMETAGQVLKKIPTAEQLDAEKKVYSKDRKKDTPAYKDLMQRYDTMLKAAQELPGEYLAPLQNHVKIVTDRINLVYKDHDSLKISAPAEIHTNPNYTTMKKAGSQEETEKQRYFIHQFNEDCGNLLKRLDSNQMDKINIKSEAILREALDYSVTSREELDEEDQGMLTVELPAAKQTQQASNRASVTDDFPADDETKARSYEADNASNSGDDIEESKKDENDEDDPVIIDTVQETKNENANKMSSINFFAETDNTESDRIDNISTEPKNAGSPFEAIAPQLPQDEGNDNSENQDLRTVESPTAKQASSGTLETEDFFSQDEIDKMSHQADDTSNSGDDTEESNKDENDAAAFDITKDTVEEVSAQISSYGSTNEVNEKKESIHDEAYNSNAHEDKTAITSNDSTAEQQETDRASATPPAPAQDANPQPTLSSQATIAQTLAQQPAATSAVKAKPLIEELEDLNYAIRKTVEHKQTKLFSKRVSPGSLASEDEKLLQWMENGINALRNMPYILIDSHAEEQQNVLYNILKKLEKHKQGLEQSDELDAFIDKFKEAISKAIEECKTIIAPPNTVITPPSTTNNTAPAQQNTSVFGGTGIQKTDTQSFICRVTETATKERSPNATPLSLTYKTSIQDKQASTIVSADEVKAMKNVDVSDLKSAMKGKSTSPTTDLLIKTVISQVDMCKQINPNAPIVINKAFSEAYVKAVMLYARSQKYEVKNETPYPPKDTRKITSEEVEQFRRHIRKNAGMHDSNVQRHLVSKFANKSIVKPSDSGTLTQTGPDTGVSQNSQSDTTPSPSPPATTPSPSRRSSTGGN